MTEMEPEKQASALPDTPAAGEDSEAEARFSQVEPAVPGTPSEVQVGGEVIGLKPEVEGKKFTEKLEADGRLQEAREVGTEQPSLEVKGFEQSGVMTNEEVNKYLKETLPAEHTRGDRITEIRYLDDYRSTPDGVILGECKTNTITKTSEIEIYRQAPFGSYDQTQMEWAITHEVGHNIYHNMTSEQQSVWENMSGSRPRQECISDYATLSSQEDFAEAYTAYVRDPALLADASLDKFNFLRNQVFHGRNYGA